MAGRLTKRHMAIVLARTKLAEQDLIVTMIDQQGEQIRAVAKGARKPGSRLAARTELFVEADMLISQGRGLGIITEAEVVDAHVGVRGDVELVAAASTICEVGRLTCYEGMPDPFLFALLARSLRACEQAADRAQLDMVIAAYVSKVVAHCGWRPVLDACVACGEELPSRLCVRAGGVLCESCARDVEDAFPISSHTLSWMRALIGQTFDALLDTPVDECTASELLEFVHRWASTHLEARLRAMEFYKVS